jgi:hypothetical protein
MAELCDTVGGICYEQIPEKLILFWLIAALVALHLIFMVLPIWLQGRTSRVDDILTTHMEGENHC